MSDNDIRVRIAEVIGEHAPTIKSISHPRRFGFILNIPACKGCAWAEEGGNHDTHRADVLVRELGLTEFAVGELPRERWWSTAIQTEDENGDWQWPK